MSSPLDPATLASLPNWKRKLPMALTWARMAVCPLFIPLIAADRGIYNWIAAALFIAASITDWADGHFARKYGMISNMGKFMDPIADKILVATVLIMMIPAGRVGPILVLLLLCRDILIGGIRSVAAADRVIIDAKAAGKWKTGMQMVAIPALLVGRPLMGVPLYEIGAVLLWISVILSLFSGYQYVRIYMENRKAEA
jgi:CDP-diacylglycerol--glycerol-3-phosphate 3-phosphatidyltransferase